jgi:methyl acetate hydrolase
VPFHLGGGDYQNGGGGLSGSGGDYLTFCRMILGRGSLNDATILKPETVVEMARNHVGAHPAGRMATAMPDLGRAYDPFPGMDCGWGLGFLINPERGPNGRAAGSLAWAGIFNSYYWIDPVSDIAGVFMAQHMPFADPGALGAYAALERMAYGIG